MAKAVCPGSFDPITKGHIDIITRASKLFEEVTALVVVNPEKKPAFTGDERADMLRRTTAHLPNVKVDQFHGLLADYVTDNQVTAIVKGLRAMSDFEYEFQMAMTNKKLAPTADTVFLTTAVENMYLSSSLVKQVASFKGNIEDFVPPEIHADIALRLCGRFPQAEI